MRSLEELSLIDDFLMNAVAQDHEVGEPCLKRILSVLLEREIAHVEITPQKAIQGWQPDLRGVRLDVELREYSESVGGCEAKILNIYDIEPHRGNDIYFPKYVRYRQARIDGSYMKRGDNEYEKLPDLYIITITDQDIFEEGYMVYMLQNHCKEVPELKYDDGVKLFFFNTVGTKGGSDAIRNMLKYIRNSGEKAAVDEATKEINGFVRQVKTDPIIREGYMTFGDVIDRERKEAAEEERYNTRVDDIIELLEDFGEVPEELSKYIALIKDNDVLKKLVKLAARVDSIESFQAKMKDV